MVGKALYLQSQRELVVQTARGDSFQHLSKRIQTRLNAGLLRTIMHVIRRAAN